MSTAEILQSPQKLTSAQLRKIKKPIIEKRRRERINESLNQLKTLVLEALNKDENQYNKMEKADILEMTVKHLRHLQRQVAQSQQTSGSRSTHAQAVTHRYKSGYSECAEEVKRYLGTTSNVSNDVKHELTAHLNSRVNRHHDTASEYRLPPSPATSPVSVHSASSRESLSSISPVSEHSLQPTLCSNPNVVFPVNSSQTMVIAGQVSPVLTGHGFVPIVISPVTSQQAVASQPMTSQPSSPLAGTVIPLYHTSPNHSLAKDMNQNVTSSVHHKVGSPDSSAKSTLHFTNKVQSVAPQSPHTKCHSSFSVQRMANFSPEPVWRPW